MPYSSVRWKKADRFISISFDTVDNTDTPTILYNIRSYYTLKYPQSLIGLLIPNALLESHSILFFLSFVFTFTTWWINGCMTWPHSCYISMSLNLLSPCYTEPVASLHWRIIDTWFTGPRWSWEESPCLLRAVMLFVGLEGGITCRILDVRPAILLKGLMLASCPFILHMPSTCLST